VPRRPDLDGPAVEEGQFDVLVVGQLEVADGRQGLDGEDVGLLVGVVVVLGQGLLDGQAAAVGGDQGDRRPAGGVHAPVEQGPRGGVPGRRLVAGEDGAADQLPQHAALDDLAVGRRQGFQRREQGRLQGLELEPAGAGLEFRVLRGGLDRDGRDVSVGEQGDQVVEPLERGQADPVGVDAGAGDQGPQGDLAVVGRDGHAAPAGVEAYVPVGGVGLLAFTTRAAASRAFWRVSVSQLACMAQ
jgi:hypothetical protein